MKRLTILAAFVAGLMALAAAGHAIPASAQEGCVNVRTGEPVGCGDPGAVTREVYNESTLRDNPGDPGPSAVKGAEGGADDEGGVGTGLILVVVAAGIAAATAGAYFVLRRRRYASADSDGRGTTPESESPTLADNAGGRPRPLPPAARSSESRNPLLRAVEERPLIACAAALTLGVVIAGGIGALLVASKSSEVDSLNSSLARAKAATADAEGQRDEAQQIADEITAQKDKIVGDAKARAEQLTTKAEDEVRELEGKIEDAQSDLDSTESRLADVQGSLAAAQETKQLSSFGDGIWQSGTDFLPGLYRASGGGGCYWAKLNSADTNDIADNGFGGSNPTIQIDSSFFETDGCGTWEKIG